MTLRKSAAVMAVLAGLSAGLPASAGELTPVGAWQASTGEARVNVTLCGDGTELCATLTWLSDDAKTDGNLALLNSYVVNKAKLVEENQWKGTVKFDGDSATGSIRLVSSNMLTVSGCKLVCKTYKFNRI
jgi:uncharacterized protein (DUF2147 family)